MVDPIDPPKFAKFRPAMDSPWNANGPHCALPAALSQHKLRITSKTQFHLIGLGETDLSPNFMKFQLRILTLRHRKFRRPSDPPAKARRAPCRFSCSNLRTKFHHRERGESYFPPDFTKFCSIVLILRHQKCDPRSGPPANALRADST